MDKSKNQNSLLFKGIKCLSKWVRRSIFIIFAACMIGLSNAFNDEQRWINNTKNFNQQEQVNDDDMSD
ncbi:MAG: hypothetical protein A2033_02700 [Bacteroidetes bacterium GWA2_31_9]|nr:MAG: hypothetical protein A2033_02700 [Bacteroidetes bacterium GWA2_31_9]